MLLGEFETIRYECQDGIALITLNRPQTMNALNAAVFGELNDALNTLEQNPAVGSLILTGAGKAFVAGADIARMREYSVLAGRQFCLQGQQFMNRLEDFNKPVIAAVNGFALGGGCELALACDIRIASEQAVFGQPEVNLGIIPGWGGTQRLSRLIGEGRAKYYIFTGEFIDAAAALRVGLVEKVVPAAELLDAARQVAKTVMSKAPIAVMMAKRAIHLGMDMDLRSGICFESEAYTTSFGAEDRIEGMSAFLEKRSPRFKGC